MGYRLGTRSKQRLKGAHPDMRKVVKLAIQYTEVDFTVLEVVRSEERQRKLFEAKASKTMNSRHLPKVPRDNPEYGPVSHAADLGAWVDGQVDWSWPLYYKIAEAMNRAADELGVNIVWGADWDDDGDTEDERWKDGPHFQLDWKDYPV